VCTTAKTTKERSASKCKGSKRGANEDSEVRYDKKHKLKQLSDGNSKKPKKDGTTPESSAVTSSSDGLEGVADVASIVSGNEDDKGSVVSAILDEDICYQCGGYTLDGNEWSSVVMCDLCDGEYHLHCQGLECTPEGAFVCSKCVEDEAFYKDVSFEVSSSFKVCTDLFTAPSTSSSCLRALQILLPCRSLRDRCRSAL
jgi:hypothetical protein